MDDSSAPYPAHREVDVVLRDGATVRIRPARREDRERIEDYLIGLSDESRYFRFGGVAVDVSEIARRSTEVDYRNHLTLLAVAEAGAGEVIGGAQYIREGDPSTGGGQRQRRRRLAGAWPRLDPGRASGRRRRRCRHLDVPCTRASGEPPDDRRLPAQRLPRSPARDAGDRGRRVPDGAHRRGARRVRGSRADRGGERRPRDPPAHVRRGDRGVARRSVDRRTAPPQPAGPSVRRRGARGQPEVGRRAGHRGVPERARHPRSRRRGVRRGAGGACHRGGPGVWREGCARTRGDLRRVRRDRLGRRRVATRAPRRVSRIRYATDRSELHGGGEHRPRRATQRHVRDDVAPYGTRRVPLAERRARDRGHGASRGARLGAVDVRLHREQGRHLRQRSPELLGRRPEHRCRVDVPRVVREPPPVRQARPPARRRTHRSSP